MKNNGVVGKKQRQPLSVKWLVLAVFRVSTMSLALVELAFFDDPALSLLPNSLIIVVAVAYTGFKLVHPLRWYVVKRPGIALTIIDVTVCALLLVIHRQIHTPFTLYALNPVLTSALLFPSKATWITGSVTAVYYAVNYFSFPLSDALENLSSIFFTYLSALVLIAWLPYILNSHVLKNLRAKAAFEERRKLGREMHDGLCQTLYGLSWELQKFHQDVTGLKVDGFDGRLEHLKGLLDKAEKEARGSIESLSFKPDRPFLQQLEDSLKHLKDKAGIGYRLDAPGGEPPLDDMVKLEVLTICEEAFRNIAKHSGARQVTVRVHSSGGHLQVNVTDDGRGIEIAGLDGNHGLTVMKERIESLGGYFEVVSAPGAGTEIRLEVPMTCSPVL